MKAIRFQGLPYLLTSLTEGVRFLLSLCQTAGFFQLGFHAESRGVKEVYALTPKSYIRFKKTGSGLNYGHGGTSLQEVVIPVIWHRNEKDYGASSKVKLSYQQ